MRSAAIAVLLMCWTAVAASAKPPKKPLPSPGVLASVHDKVACDQCHDKTRSRVVRAKCLACHAPLDKRLASGSGLHASGAVATKRCETCHRDHRGKAASVGGWDGLRGGEAGFDHLLTGWTVEHRGVSCAACHASGTYVDRNGLEKPDGSVRCDGCHSGVPHDGRYADDECVRCHQQAGIDARMDRATARATAHADDGAFPLAKGHALACETCHRVTRAGRRVSIFNAMDPQCSGCHGDVHRGALGTTCDKCHRSGSWDDVEAPRPARCSRCHGANYSAPVHR